MKKYIAWPLAFCLSFALLSRAQEIPVNEYGLRVVNSLELYNQLAAADSTNILVDLEAFLPGITLDIRYASENNFTGKKLYDAAKAFVRLPVAYALRNARAELLPFGIDFKIYDAYRPYSITKAMWEVVKDDNFAASPKTGSRHNRGCAVDITLINAVTKAELQMPTPYDDFSLRAASAFKDIPDSILAHRTLLQLVLTRNGFQMLKSEWWHFDFTDWKKYPIIDISFASLMRH